MDFEAAKSYLSKKVEKGQSIYDHLSGIVRKIIEDKPEDPLNQFENLSLEVKDGHIPLSNSDFPIISSNETERQEILSDITNTLQLYGKKLPKPKKQKSEDDDDEDNDEEEEDETEEEEPIEMSKIANILENMQILQWSGIEFSNKNELFQLQQSIIKFIKTKQDIIETSRFFGKIQAIYNDYWIIECILTEYPEPPENKPEKQEDPGIGCNEYVYFVCTNLTLGEWIQLPDITPDQIKQSRNVYRLFTGNLENKVLGRTYFNGLEKHLLRSQISRISSSCILAPSSYYNPPEEEDEENPLLTELNEEFEGIEEPTSLESWVHTRGHLRLEGRLLKFNTPEPEDEDDEDAEKEEKEPTPEEAEEVISILRGINEDQSNELKILSGSNNDDDDEDGGDDDDDGGINVWYIRDINNKNPYSICSINNKLWCGHQTLHIKNTKTFLNIYIGNGIKYRSEYYEPKPPLIIQSLFNEWKEIEIENEIKDENEDENDENENENDEPKMKIVSIFDTIQSEVLPPPPPPENENGDGDDGNEEPEEEEEEDID